MKLFFRKKYFIEKQLQTKFILFTILLLMVYTLLFVLILFAPYVIPLNSGYALKEQTDAARMVLSLHRSIWPALGIVSLILGVLSIFVSHKVAGPVYRLKRSLAEIAGGNIDLEIKLRKRDELHDLAAGVNLVTHEMRYLVRTLKYEHESVSDCIAVIERQVEKHQFNEAASQELFAKLQSSQHEIAQALAKYRTD